MGQSAQQMKHEHPQKISPNSSPDSSPRLPPESSKFVATISLWGKSGVTNRMLRIARPKTVFYTSLLRLFSNRVIRCASDLESRNP